MPVAAANGIELHYDTFGNPQDEPIVLIMGLSCQMLFWPERFCQQLADRGFHVVRFDNRDVGLSTTFDDSPPPNIFAGYAGDGSTAVYSLSDMAADVVGLMDALGFPAAHLVGQSMGGMIAQTAAIEHSSRVLSLTSISSTTGDKSVGFAHPEAFQARPAFRVSTARMRFVALSICGAHLAPPPTRSTKQWSATGPPAATTAATTPWARSGNSWPSSRHRTARRGYATSEYRRRSSMATSIHWSTCPAAGPRPRRFPGPSC